MKSSPILAAAALFARGALSTCSLAGSLAGRTCEWQGTSPACGEAEAGLELGKDTAGGGQLVAWTRDHSWSELFDLGSEGVSDDGFDLYKAVLPCAEQYGAVCLGGYKRLVCKGEKVRSRRDTQTEGHRVSKSRTRFLKRRSTPSTRPVRPVPKATASA